MFTPHDILEPFDRFFEDKEDGARLLEHLEDPDEGRSIPCDPAV